jgi:hypothetical protein
MKDLLNLIEQFLVTNILYVTGYACHDVRAKSLQPVINERPLFIKHINH